MRVVACSVDASFTLHSRANFATTTKQMLTIDNLQKSAQDQMLRVFNLRFVVCTWESRCSDATTHAVDRQIGQQH